MAGFGGTPKQRRLARHLSPARSWVGARTEVGGGDAHSSPCPRPLLFLHPRGHLPAERRQGAQGRRRLLDARFLPGTHDQPGRDGLAAPRARSPSGERAKPVGTTGGNEASTRYEAGLLLELRSRTTTVACRLMCGFLGAYPCARHHGRLHHCAAQEKPLQPCPSPLVPPFGFSLQSPSFGP
jgi:hypothetical protein